jgi:hypothetical protein
MRKIEIEIGGQWVENPVAYLPGVVGAATLLEDRAPQICEALWNALPIETRTIHAFQAGQTWRTEKNIELVSPGVVENYQETWQQGDIIYLNSPELPLFKVFFVYGNARPPSDQMSVIARVDENFDQLDKISRRILYEGPKNVTIRRRE